MKTAAPYMLHPFRFLFIVCLFVSMLGGKAVHAQFVNIPDAVFRNYIATLDPTAINGTNMDTTNVTVTTLTNLNISNLGISDITGIEYFDNLQSFTCTNNNISIFSSIFPNGTHEFPAGLTFINCAINPNLQNLPLMPPTISYINANDCNALNSVYPLPNGGPQLTTLLLHATGISTLPELKQSIVSYLDLDSCLLLSCLPQLPDSLHNLFANYTGITCLPNIPANGNFTTNTTTTVCNGVVQGVVTHPSCYGYCDGEVTVMANAVNTIYSWNTGFNDTNATGLSFQSNLCDGIYTISITPVAGGCPSYSINTLIQPSQQLLGQPTIDPVPCFGDSTWVYYPGNPPFTFNWSTGATGDSVYIPAGNYTVFITSVSCPVAPAAFTVFQPAQLQVPNAGAVTVCNGNPLCVAPIGGTFPYNYLWSDFVITPCHVISGPGTYIITVTDINACTTTDTFTVNVSLPVSVQLNPPVYCNGMPPQTLFAVVNGGTAPYVFAWSDGTTLDHVQVNSQGTYTVTVIDINGCTGTASVSTVTTGGPLIAGITAQSLPTCVTCDGTVTGDAGPFPGPFTTSFYPSSGLIQVAGPTFTGFCADTLYALLVDDGAGGTSCLSFSLPDSCELVWPGDANHDGVADNMDLLALGVAFGSTGPVRANASGLWIGQPALSWNGALVSTSNYKHVDCDGDGIINDADTIPLLLNFGSVHPLKPFPIPTSTTDPYLFFDITIDTVGTSQTLQIPLNLGTAALPVDSLYGIAFTITYDTALVKPDSVSLDFSNSWIGSNGSNLLFIQHNDPVNGMLYGALSRTNHTDTSGFGTLAVFTIVTTDNVSGKLTMPVYDTLRFELNNITAIDHAEQNRPVQALNDSIVVEDVTLIQDLEAVSRRIVLYPSPAKDYLTVSVPADFVYYGMQIHNMSGVEMGHMERSRHTLFRIDLTGYNNGIYTLSFRSERGSIVKKFGVMK